MTLHEKHLAEDEHVVLELREHWKAVAWPLVLLVVLAVAAVVAWALLPQVAAWVVSGLALVAALVWVAVPVARWRTTVYTVTDKRISLRSGLVTRVGRDIPLYRINDIASERGLLDRVFGCGTLVISDASEKPGLVLHDVPDSEAVQVRLQELLFAHDDGSDDGEFPPTEPERVRRGH